MEWPSLHLTSCPNPLETMDPEATCLQGISASLTKAQQSQGHQPPTMHLCQQPCCRGSWMQFLGSPSLSACGCFSLLRGKSRVSEAVLPFATIAGKPKGHPRARGWQSARLEHWGRSALAGLPIAPAGINLHFLSHLWACGSSRV